MTGAASIRPRPTSKKFVQQTVPGTAIPLMIKPTVAFGGNRSCFSMKRWYRSPVRRRPEFEFADDEPDDEVQRATTLRKQAASIARQAAMDPDDGLGL